MSIECTAILSGRIPLRDEDGVAHYRVTDAAERAREAIESAGRRAAFARKSLGEALSVASPALRFGLTGRAEGSAVGAADRRPAATWSQAVDISGRLVPGVTTDAWHPGIGGAIRFDIDPENATAVMVGQGWKFEVDATPGTPPGVPAKRVLRAATPAQASEQPVADAIGGLRALRLALDEPLPDLGGLWRVWLLPPVGGGIEVEVLNPAVGVQLRCATAAYRASCSGSAPMCMAGGSNHGP